MESELLVRLFRGIAYAATGAMAAALLALLAACGGGERAYVERPVEQLYNEAMDLLLDGDYAAAAESFDEVERQHPYSVWATRAQVMAAYSYYENDAYDEAVIAARRFVDLHPGHRDAPYAYYLVAVSYYEQITDVGRDQRNTELALQSLDELVRRFPNTPYARDASLKVDLTRDHLAGKDMEIGRYYLHGGHYIAAINRFRSVIQNYQTTSHVPEALHRLAESYAALGVRDEAQASAAVLGYNFPGSEWYIDSYSLLVGVDVRNDDDDSTWLGRTLDWIF